MALYTSNDLEILTSTKKKTIFFRVLSYSKGFNIQWLVIKKNFWFKRRFLFFCIWYFVYLRFNQSNLSLSLSFSSCYCFFVYSSVELLPLLGQKSDHYSAVIVEEPGSYVGREVFPHSAP